MKIAVIIVRILLGLMFLNASIGYFFNLYETPKEIPQDTMTYMSGLSVVHLMDIVKSIELLCAIALLAGRYVALAVIVLFPITFNIVLLHGVLEPGSFAFINAVIVLLMHLFLFYAYRKHYATLFKAKRID